MAVLSTLSGFLNPLKDYVKLFTESETWHIASKHKLLILVGLFATYGIYKFATRPRNLPPGPCGLPIIGSLLDLSENTHYDFIRLSQKYKSDIISLYMGKQLIVALNNEELIKEAFLKSDDLSDRGDFSSFMDLDEQLLSASNTERWRRFKSFFMSSLRTHGFGTPKSEDQMSYQMRKVFDIIETTKTFTSQKAVGLITKGTANVILNIMAGKTFEYDDPELLHIISKVQEFEKSFFEDSFAIVIMMNMGTGPLFWPFMKTLKKRFAESTSALRRVLKKYYDEHAETLDENHPRDCIDDNIIQFKNDPVMTEKMILDSILLVMPDAMEGIAFLIIWCAMFLCYNPDVQDKMAKEISEICGNNMPSMKDRIQLVYCEATFLECLRRASIFSLSGAHTSHTDVKIAGYNIPKGTQVQANIYAVHNNEKVFPEPKKFKVERFLSKDGKVINADRIMPFGLGRRKCPGEPLTKSQVFLYLTGLVQRFKMTFVEGHEPSCMEGKGLFKIPPECTIRFTTRM